MEIPMGLGIALEDFKRETLDRVDDTQNFLHRLLPPASEDSDSLLARIDWYGDTYFNYLQMRQFLCEWDELANRAQTPERTSFAIWRQKSGQPMPEGSQYPQIRRRLSGGGRHTVHIRTARISPAHERPQRSSIGPRRALSGAALFVFENGASFASRAFARSRFPR